MNSVTDRHLDKATMQDQRLSACPPHLRAKLLDQFEQQRRREYPEFAAASIALEAVIRDLLARFGPPPTKKLEPKPIDLKWHRRRWLP